MIVLRFQIKKKKTIRVEGASAIEHVSEDVKDNGPHWTS